MCVIVMNYFENVFLIIFRYTKSWLVDVVIVFFVYVINQFVNELKIDVDTSSAFFMRTIVDKRWCLKLIFDFCDYRKKLLWKFFTDNFCYDRNFCCDRNRNKNFLSLDDKNENFFKRINVTNDCFKSNDLLTTSISLIMRAFIAFNIARIFFQTEFLR